MSAVRFIVQIPSNRVFCRHQGGCIGLGVFGELGDSLSKAVDIFKSLGSVEGQSSRTDADNRTIVIMKG